MTVIVGRGVRRRLGFVAFDRLAYLSHIIILCVHPLHFRLTVDSLIFLN